MVSNKEKIISLVGNAVFSIPLSEDFEKELSLDEAKLLYHNSKMHDLAHLIASALKENSISIPAEIEGKFQKQLFLSVYRTQKLQFEYKRLSSLFEAEQLPFIPLKGTVLRPFYPEAWMRTSCDIDLLLRESDLERASRIVTDLAGYKALGQWKGELSFSSADGIHLELHFFNKEDKEKSVIFREIWEHVSPGDENTFCMQTEWEFFYAHHVMHMAKHFAHGGCGIRPFVDLFLMREKIPMDSQKKNAFLEKFGLSAFADACERLASVWFGDAEHTDLSEQMQEYLLGAGIFGSIENQVALEKSGKSTLLGGFFQHVWLPYDVIKYQFPVLMRAKWLLPVCQVVRWFKLVFCGGIKRSAERLRQNQRISDEKVRRVARLMDQLKLT